MDKLLTELANRYQSDKGTEYSSKHAFSEIYDDYFSVLKNKSISILEIGVHDGSSLKMWYDYFPKAIIYGLDIDDKSLHNNDRVSCGILDQSKAEHLYKFAQNIGITFDIIIDDGSHHMRDQQITFGYLFPILKSNGLYVLEDLHTSLCKNNTGVYGRPIEIWENSVNTTLYYLNNFPCDSVYLNPSQNHYIKDNVKDIKVHSRDNQHVPLDYAQKSITSVITKK